MRVLPSFFLAIAAISASARPLPQASDDVSLDSPNSPPTVPDAPVAANPTETAARTSPTDGDAVVVDNGDGDSAVVRGDSPPVNTDTGSDEDTSINADTSTDADTSTNPDPLSDDSDSETAASPTGTDAEDSTVTSSSSSVSDATTETSPTDSASSAADAPAATNAGPSLDIPVPPPACVAKAGGSPVLTTSSPAPTSDAGSSLNATAPTNATSSTNATESSSNATSSSTDAASSNATVSGSSSSTAALPSVTSSNLTLGSNATAAGNVSVTKTPLAPKATSTTAAKLDRRIAQDDLPAVAQSWQDLCLVSGGDIFTNDPCVKLAGIDGINALLGDAEPCAQQDNADAMIDFAKSAGVTNADALIANAIAYRKHPRNAIPVEGVIPSSLFCNRAPKNQELAGIVNAQLDGVDFGNFGTPAGLVAFGADGTCPFGQTPDESTCGCA